MSGWWEGQSIPKLDVVRLRTDANTLLREAKSALSFLENLEASANPCTDPASPEATGFHLTAAGLRSAIAKAEKRA
jgi:hypothetical protein